MLEAIKGRAARWLSVSLVLSLALMAGRLAGFVRELVLASSLGLSADADMAVLVLTLPDLLVNLLLSGGLAIALVPALQRAGPAQAAALFRQSSLWVGLVFGILGMAIGLFPQAWLPALAPGLHGSPGLVESGALLVLGASFPLAALSGVSSAALQSQQKFFIAGCGTLIFNLSVIGGLLGASYWALGPLNTLCWAILLGATLRWLSQMAALPRSKGQTAGSARLVDAALLKTFGAGLLSASLLILVPVIIRSFASLIGPGQIAAFNYANKLLELPLGILITTLATVAFPRLCELHAQGERDAAMSVLRAAIARASVLAMSVLGTGLWFGDAVVALLLQRGKIDAPGAQAIAQLLSIALISVPFVGLSSLATAALNARQQTGLVLKLSLGSLGLLLVFCVPGLLNASAPQLMWAMVGFHICYAALTLGYTRRYGSAPRWPLEFRILPAAALSATACLAGALADSLLPGIAVWARVLLAILTFSLAAWIGLRALRTSVPTSLAT